MMSSRATPQIMVPVHAPMPPRAVFLARFAAAVCKAISLLALSLLLGAIGYHFSERLPWLDATLNAAMLLAGEGPIAPLHTTGGKVFAIAYAIFGGVVFVTAASVLIGPLAQRFLHRFHLELWGDAENT